MHTLMSYEVHTFFRLAVSHCRIHDTNIYNYIELRYFLKFLTLSSYMCLSCPMFVSLLYREKENSSMYPIFKSRIE